MIERGHSDDAAADHHHPRLRFHCIIPRTIDDGMLATLVGRLVPGRDGATTACPFPTLTLKPALRQKRDLLRRRLPAEDDIAVRESAEALDDVAVKLRPRHHVVETHRLEQAYPAPLRIEVFGMFERHDKPARHCGRHCLVIPARDGTPGNS